MALGDGKIGRVVSRGYLEDARAEGHVDLLVADDGDPTLLWRKFGGKRTEGKLTDEGGVARVFGIYGDGGISRNRFGSGGRDGEELLLGSGYGDTEMVEQSLLLFHDDLLIGKSGPRNWAPVDHSTTPIDQFLMEEIDKDFLDASRVGGVHGKAFPGPVAGSPQFFQLLDNDSAVFFFPLPDFLKESLPPQIVPMSDLSVFFQGPLDHGLRGDAGMVGARQPENLHPEEASPTGEDVLNRVVEDMTQSEDSGHIGRRNDDGVSGFGGSGIGSIIAAIDPLGVKPVFDLGGIVTGGEFRHGRERMPFPLAGEKLGGAKD